jgi:hypothetical protein
LESITGTILPGLEEASVFYNIILSGAKKLPLGKALPRFGEWVEHVDKQICDSMDYSRALGSHPCQLDDAVRFCPKRGGEACA